MLASASFREKGAEAVIKSTSSLIRRKHAIRLNAMLQAVQLPAGIAHLATSLANVNRNALPHFVINGLAEVELRINCHCRF
jgi:hypothetical protein